MKPPTEDEYAGMVRTRDAVRKVSAVLGCAPEEIALEAALVRLEALVVAGEIPMDRAAPLLSKKRRKRLMRAGDKEARKAEQRVVEVEAILSDPRARTVLEAKPGPPA